MGEHLTRFDGSGLRVVEGETCALCAAGSDDGQVDCGRIDGALAAIQGIYRWADAELAVAAEREGAAKTLINAYRAMGARVLEKIEGQFSLALVVEETDEVFLATDRIASEPLVYSVSGRSIVFSSTLSAMREHPLLDCQIDPQSIFNYLFFHVIPGPETIYKEQHKILPGTCAHFINGDLKLSRYWQIDYREDAGAANMQEMREELFALLRSSIQGFSQAGKVGAFLSGGTDSSTVSGILSQVLDAPVPTYSIGFSAEGYDEMEYARIASTHFETEHHEYYVTPDDIVAAVPKIASIYSEPFGNSSAVPTYYCAKLARTDGVTRMLAGDGGDELFAGNPHYARQYLFSVYDALPETLRKSVIEPAVMSSGYPQVTVPLKKLRSYVEQAMVPMPERLETYNLLTRLGVQHVVNPEFLQQIEPLYPYKLMSEHYCSSNARTMLNKMLWFDFKFVLADKDLPKVSRMCELAGLQVAYPILGDEIIAFAARIPPKLKLKGQKLRYFFKEALREFLPAEIIAKKKHGFGLPVGNWVSSHKELGQLASDNLNDLKSRKIVRADLIDSLIDTRLGEHAPYYGNMVWILLMLEQWFKAHHAKSH
jgi:asparagine synthase (glutamine-hydrolysing)